MEYVVGALALLFVLSMGFAALTVVRTVRALKRGAERTGRQVRRAVRDATMKARVAQPGAIGELARIRVDLRASIDTTRQVLEAGVRTDPSLSEALGLLDRLQGHARQLDTELGVLMDREPDRTRVAAQLPDARRRVEGIRRSADALRWAAQDRARGFTQEGLASLDQQIETEASALRHWQNSVGPKDAALSTGQAEGGGDSVRRVEPGPSSYGDEPSEPHPGRTAPGTPDVGP